MSTYETIASGRSKRSTAGNRMRELLEKAHQEDDDEIFAEVENDEEFAEPLDQRDVFLEDFADTDEEVEMDEEEQEKEMRREERRKAKGKGKVAYNPLAPSTSAKPKQTRFESARSTNVEEITLLDSNIDPSLMAPSTLLLTLRKQRREAKRANRSEARRSNLRASTLRTEAEIAEKEEQEKILKSQSKMGRKAQHITGEIRGARPMTQDELIAAALEEEERNKEALSAWIRREEERRELRRVGRKRVKGPRWTFISRTVGKLVEVIDEPMVENEPLVDANANAGPSETSKMPANPASAQIDGDDNAAQPITAEAQDQANLSTLPTEITNGVDTVGIEPKPQTTVSKEITNEENTQNPANPPKGQVSSLPNIGQPLAEPNLHEQSATDPKSPSVVDTSNAAGPAPADISQAPEVAVPTPVDETQTQTSVQSQAPSTLPAITSTDTANDSSQSQSTPSAPGPSSTIAQASESENLQYTRNYLVLSQVLGGLPAELKVILGDHVEWDEVQYIPVRNRPINRRPPACPITGSAAKYRHPESLTPYANSLAYKEIEAILLNRYVWNADAHCWFGGEEDVFAEGMEGIEGWEEALHGGWLGGEVIPEPELEPEPEPVIVPDEKELVEEVNLKGKGRGKRKRKESVLDVGSEVEVTPSEIDDKPAVPPKKKVRGKGKKK